MRPFASAIRGVTMLFYRTDVRLVESFLGFITVPWNLYKLAIVRLTFTYCFDDGSFTSC